MVFCIYKSSNIVSPQTDEEGLQPSAAPSIIIFNLSIEDKEMVTVLTKRLMMYIGVQGSVESLLGAIFEIYYRNGYIGDNLPKINIYNIFDDNVLKRLFEYYRHNTEVMDILNRYCYFKEQSHPVDELDEGRRLLCCNIM